MRWVIGDIHGMLRPLETLLVAVRARDWNPQFIFTGDYVNRGPDSSGVIDLLLSLNDAIFIRGNHDDIFDLVLHGECFAAHDQSASAVAAFRWFSQHGLRNTLTSYGITPAEIDAATRKLSEERLKLLVATVPQRHRTFIRNLVPVAEFSDLFVAHAMWDPLRSDEFAALANDRRARHRLLWNRFNPEQLDAPKAWKRVGYFGHTPVMNYNSLTNRPLRGTSIVLADTGAALGPRGRLSAICPETGVILQSDPNGILLDPM